MPPYLEGRASTSRNAASDKEEERKALRKASAADVRKLWADEPIEEMEVSETQTENEEDEEDPLPTLEEVANLSASLPKPHLLKEGWTASSVVDSAEETKVATTLADLKGELECCNVVLAFGTSAAAFGVDTKVAAAKKDNLERAIAKVSRAAPTPSASVDAAQLRLDKEKYEEKHKKEKLRQEAGAAKAADRFAELQLAQAKLRNYWAAQLAAEAEAQTAR